MKRTANNRKQAPKTNRNFFKKDSEQRNEIGDKNPGTFKKYSGKKTSHYSSELKKRGDNFHHRKPLQPFSDEVKNAGGKNEEKKIDRTNKNFNGQSNQKKERKIELKLNTRTKKYPAKNKPDYSIGKYRKQEDTRPARFSKRGKGFEHFKNAYGNQKSFLPPKKNDEIRLNKFISNSGVTSRRKADELIKAGAIKVNGIVVTEMGYKVLPNDKVTYKEKPVKPVNHVYILLNKPKDYLTTVTDDRNRQTVMELIAAATKERVYPVGRLDRNTTGLLLFTNDGELAQKLSHPSHSAKKVYYIELDKNVDRKHIEMIGNGIELDDGIASVDEVAYAHPVHKNIVGITLHAGKNRIVRRIFEALGYKVLKLDRTYYAGLTKKDLPRGRWRFLTAKEITLLKHFK